MNSLEYFIFIVIGHLERWSRAKAMNKELGESLVNGSHYPMTAAS